MSRLYGVIVTYRRPAELDRALTVLADPAHGIHRLVVVDNAASPETAAILARHPEPACRLVAAPENLGPAGGLALGLQEVLAEASDDDWAVLLDDDNVKAHAPPLARLHGLAVAARAADPTVGMVGAVGGRLDRRRGVLVRPADAELGAEWVPVDFVAGGQFPLIAVAALRDVGPFRADLFFGLEELDFGLRLTSAGYRVVAHGPTWLERRRCFGRLGNGVAPVARDPAPWRRYYAVRNLIVVLRSHGLRTAAAAATLAAAARPLADWRRRRGQRLVLARLTAAGIADAWLGRTGRRVNPEAWPVLSARGDVKRRGSGQAEWIDHRGGGEASPLGARRRPPGPGTERVKVVYIAGYGRSGSTLCDLLLGQQAGWVSCGELRQLPTAVRDGYRCGCGETILSCSRWSAVIDKVAGEPSELVARFAPRREVLRVRRVPGLVWPRLFDAADRRRLSDLTEATGALYGAVAATTGARVVVDSSKDPLWGLLLARTPAIDLRVVHLVRDPRAVAHSWTRSRPRPELSDRGATMPVHPPVHTALEWDLRNALAWVLGRVAVSYVRVRYEDLVTDPAAVVAAVAAAAGEPAPDGPVERDGRLLVDPANHTVAGNPLRFSHGPLVLRADEEWRHAMSPRDRRTVALLTLPLRLPLRY